MREREREREREKELYNQKKYNNEGTNNYKT